VGLDVSAYEFATLVEEVHAIEDSEGHYCGDPIEHGGMDHVRVYGGDFPYTLGSLQDGHCYVIEGDTFGFRAGSYSGYGAFRTALCRTALGVEPEEVWEDPESFSDKPFVELINFSDCEGTMGPEVCAELRDDFIAERENVRDKLEELDPHPEGGWYTKKYDDWQQAFELAAETGFVSFH